MNGSCYHSDMTEEVREKMTERMQEQGLSRADLARAVARPPQAITRALNGTKDGGTVPPLWAAMLDALGLELTVRSKQA